MKHPERDPGYTYGRGMNERPQDPDRCVADVYDKFAGFYQCSRPRGHGPGGKYCKQHAKGQGMSDE